MERRRMHAADLFERDVSPAEIARQVGVSHQIVSDWRSVTMTQCGRQLHERLFNCGWVRGSGIVSGGAAISSSP